LEYALRLHDLLFQISRWRPFKPEVVMSVANGPVVLYTYTIINILIFKLYYNLVPQFSTSHLYIW